MSYNSTRMYGHISQQQHIGSRRFFPLRRISTAFVLVLLLNSYLPVSHAQVARTLIASTAFALIASNAAGVTQLTTSELVSIAVGAAIILGQSTREDPPNQCALSGYPRYTYEASLSLCYRTVASPLSVTAAEAACAADGTNSQLLRVSSVEVFNFLVQQKQQNSGISSFYIQGKRINGWSPYLYNDGTTITYFNWSTGQPSGVGLYLATASADTRMQTDDGTSPRSYVCAVYPPTSLPAR